MRWQKSHSSRPAQKDRKIDQRQGGRYLTESLHDETAVIGVVIEHMHEDHAPVHATLGAAQQGEVDLLVGSGLRKVVNVVDQALVHVFACRRQFLQIHVKNFVQRLM